MKIIRVTPSKHVPDRYWIELDGGEQMAVTVAQIADYSIYTGRELDEDELAALRDDARLDSAKARALRILGSRNMSRRQMTERLTQKGESEDTANETADWLERVGAIDDANYAGMIVRSYSAKGFGAAKIKNELTRRGIPRELWDEALSGLDSQDEAAFEFISAKLRGNAPDRQELQRAMQAAYRRGFSWDDIHAASARYEREYEGIDDE